MPTGDALYIGHVHHQRHRPRAHRLRYAVFYLLLDIDQMAATARRLWLIGHNRRGVFGVHDRDHGAAPGQGLRAMVLAQLAAAGVDVEGLAGGQIHLLTMPRVMGYGFNPLSLFYCHDAAGRLAAILYEVRNTFGERHFYAHAVTGSAVLRHSSAKAFYVSPFLPDDLQYDFVVAPPDERLRVEITAHDGQGPMLYAALSGQRRALTNGALLSAALRFPLQSIKVITAIHWEACKIWAKKIPIWRHPKRRLGGE